MLTNIPYILIAILILGVIIFMHELGHYLVGRLSGIGIIEFAVGFGPKILGWKRKGIEYSLRVLPLGGFCKFIGEDDGDQSAPNAMNNMPVWKRFLTVFAGPAMNFILAFAAAVLMLCLFYVYDVYPKIDTVAENTPAYEAQLQEGDVILSANGAEIEYTYTGVEALRAIIQESETLGLSIERGGEQLSVSLSPDMVVADESTGETTKQIGITFVSRNFNLAEAIPGAGQYMLETTKMMIDVLKNLIFKFEGAEGLAGPVGTISVVSELVQSDSRLILNIVFLISLNLGIMNLLPFPGLDGCRLIFLIVEAARGKPVPPEKEGMVHAAGLILLLALSAVLMYHDIVTYIIK